MSRRVAHLDMDAFYASVELLKYPELKGQPVVIGGSRVVPGTVQGAAGRFETLHQYAGRGVVTTSTYEARALGVFSAMGLMKAAQLAPQAILLPADFDSYRHYSQLFKEAVRSITPHIEDRGIDEIYIDLTDEPEDSATLAARIKAAVQVATGLSCSIGIAPNKLLAKICSDLDKPNGTTVLLLEDVPTRIWPLPVRKINGIGPKANEKLAGLGIYTIADLAGTGAHILHTHFGRSYAEWLRNAAQGLDERVVATRSEPKSLSRETTFERNLHPRLDRAELAPIFTNLCKRLSDDLVRKGYVGRTVGVKLRYADFKIVTRDITLAEPTNDALTIRRAAAECVRRAPLSLRLRLLGVRMSALSPAPDEDSSSDNPQGRLFN